MNNMGIEDLNTEVDEPSRAILRDEKTQQLIGLATSAFQKRKFARLQSGESQIPGRDVLKAEQAYTLAWQSYINDYCEYYRLFVNSNLTELEMQSEAQAVFSEYTGLGQVNDFRRYLVSSFNDQTNDERDFVASPFMR